MSRRIFRESALQRHNERLERVELPRYAATPWVLTGWAIASLLVVLAVLLQAIRLPHYAEGTGIVLPGSPSSERAVLAALLPAESAAQVEIGQRVWVFLPPATGEATRPVGTTIVSIDSQPVSPVAVRERFNLGSLVDDTLAGPVIVAHVLLDQPAAMWAGSVADVQVEVGSRSGLSLLPVVGSWLSSRADDLRGEQ